MRHYRQSMVIITIDNQGKRTFNDLPCDTNESLRRKFNEWRTKNPLILIGIRADAGAPYQAVTTVMLLARAAGISQIFLIVGEAATDESGKPIVIEQSLKLVLE